MTDFEVFFRFLEVSSNLDIDIKQKKIAKKYSQFIMKTEISNQYIKESH